MYVVTAIVLVVSALGHGVSSEEYFVSPASVLVESFDGWGTSFAWWPDVLGAMPQDVIDAVNAAFFSPDHLNFNIVRYTIGGTTPGPLMCGPFRPGGGTESFLDGPDQAYNWERDPRQRAILQAAKNWGADTFEAFSNSPPQWMTISGCSKGNDGGGNLHENFDPVNAYAFADYATEVIKHFHETWGITFSTYAPYNEPSGLGRGYWDGTNQNQEGCSMSLPVMASVLEAMAEAITRKNMNYVTLTIADETQINQAIVSQEFFFQQGLSHLAEKVNTHGYSDDGTNRRDLMYMRSKRDGHRLWMDEIGWSESPWGEMNQGLTLARRIITDIREMLPSAWVYWQAMEEPGVWGLLSVPYGNPSVGAIRYNSGFYAMKQFSKYIKKGSTIIQINNENAVAAFDPSSNSLVIVVLNDQDSDSGNDHYRLDLFSTSSVISATRTSKTEQSQEIQPPAFNRGFDYVAPGRSITTFVISNAQIQSSRENLLQNGDFESGTDFWEFYTWGAGEPNGNVDSSYAFQGNRNAVLDSSAADVQISQTFTVANNAAPSRTFFVTAWCRTNGGLRHLGVVVSRNGETQYQKEIRVDAQITYKSHGLSFDAEPGDEVKVYFWAQQHGSTSYIDDVFVTHNN